ncbi:hypothetical protein KSW81_004367 [Nannochloris sp. 'desiccata']|nr:hypothetical protein KSW81_004367 [Chlorella desiccata (nom. nud.)]
MEAIQEKLAAWLPQNLLEELRSQKTATAPNAQPWLKLPTMAAAGHLELVREVLANPRSVCVALWQYLASKDEFSRGSRVWLRTSMPWESSECVPLSHSLRLAAAAPSSLRSFSGVVAAISSEKDFIVEMTYGCGVCDSEKRIFLSGSSSSHVCCGFPMKHDLRRGLVLASASTILLASATSTPSSAHPASTVAVPVVVRLLDDLAGSCKPGDLVTCTGITECIVESRACSQGRPVLSEVRVEAIHVLHHPTALRTYELPEQSPSKTSFTKQAFGCFKALLGALNDWLHPPCCSLALAALLVSACSADCGGAALPPSSVLSTQEQIQLSNDFECDTLNLSNSRDTFCGDHRINILLLTGGGHDTFENSLRLVAQALCAHVTDGSLPGSNLLPTVLEFPGVPSLVSAGQLAQANSGICLLTQTLTVKQGRAVGEALRAGHATVALPVGETCTIDIHPTVWCISAAQDISPKQQPQPAGKKSGKGSSNSVVAPLAVLFAEKSSPQLAAQFDITIDCFSIEDNAAEAWADEYLTSIVYGERRWQEEEEERSCNTSKRVAAPLALENHIAACHQLPQPRMTASAMGLLKSYWTATRAAGTGVGGGTIGISGISLETAAKLAAASARLFHRAEILAFPDATLAVAFCEEGLIARGWNSELWGSLREHMARGRDLDECLNELFKQLLQVSKEHGWEWGAYEE